MSESTSKDQSPREKDCERCARYEAAFDDLLRLYGPRLSNGWWPNVRHRLKMWWVFRLLPALRIGPVPYEKASIISLRPLSLYDVIQTHRLNARFNWEPRIAARKTASKESR